MMTTLDRSPDPIASPAHSCDAPAPDPSPVDAWLAARPIRRTVTCGATTTVIHARSRAEAARLVAEVRAAHAERLTPAGLERAALKIAPSHTTAVARNERGMRPMRRVSTKGPLARVPPPACGWQEAARLLIEQRGSPELAAAAIGVSDSSVRRWARGALVPRGKGARRLKALSSDPAGEGGR